MDGLDRAILRELRQDARLPTTELARRIGASRTTAHERLQALHRGGVIQGSTIRIDPASIGAPLRAFLLVGWRTDVATDQRKVAREITQLPGVERVHIVTGGHDFLVEALAKDMDAVGRLIIEKIRSIPGVGKTESLLSFWTFEGQGVDLQGDD